jgi:hypothetical protein
MSSEVPATPVDETVYQGAIGIGTYPAQLLGTKSAFWIRTHHSTQRKHQHPSSAFHLAAGAFASLLRNS